MPNYFAYFNLLFCVYFQYFINTADSDVEYYLKLFTFLSDYEIDNLLSKHEVSPGLEVIKIEFILKLKIKCNGWLLVDTCPQAANHCTLI